MPTAPANWTSCGSSLASAVLQQQPDNRKIRPKVRQAAQAEPRENSCGAGRALWIRLECTVGETERLNGVTRHGVHDELAGRVGRKPGKHVGARQPHQGL